MLIKPKYKIYIYCPEIRAQIPTWESKIFLRDEKNQNISTLFDFYIIEIRLTEF